MSTAAQNHRKLIDIKPEVFEFLSQEASRQGVSLKKYIENLLEDACPKEGKTVADSSISHLLGSALPKHGTLASINDERLRHILAK